MSRTMALIGLAILSFFAPASYAAIAGSITGVGVSASQTTLGAAVTITIFGQGTCAGLTIDYGDGSKATLAAVGFPKKFSHAYAKAGTMNVNISAGSLCQGHASAAIVVQKPVYVSRAILGPPNTTLTKLPSVFDRLDAVLTNTALLNPCVKPSVDNGVDQPVEGGDQIWFTGCGFGRTMGHIFIWCSCPANGEEFYDTQFHNFRGLVSWTDQHIAAPLSETRGYLDHVLDQNMTLSIVSNAGGTSDPYPIQFRATRAIKYYQGPMSIDCSSNSQHDNCGPGAPDYDWHIVSGHHKSDCCFNPATGTDIFTTALPVLANDYVYDHVILTVYAYDRYNIATATPSDSCFAPSPGTFTCKVDWNTGDALGGIGYDIDIVVAGPKTFDYR